MRSKNFGKRLTRIATNTQVRGALRQKRSLQQRRSRFLARLSAGSIYEKPDAPSEKARIETGHKNIEVYYNIAFTPWLHVTPDFQATDPIVVETDSAYTLALRVKVDL